MRDTSRYPRRQLTIFLFPLCIFGGFENDELPHAAAEEEEEEEEEEGESDEDRSEDLARGSTGAGAAAATGAAAASGAAGDAAAGGALFDAPLAEFTTHVEGMANWNTVTWHRLAAWKEAWLAMRDSRNVKGRAKTTAIQNGFKAKKKPDGTVIRPKILPLVPHCSMPTAKRSDFCDVPLQLLSSPSLLACPNSMLWCLIWTTAYCYSSTLAACGTLPILPSYKHQCQLQRPTLLATLRHALQFSGGGTTLSSSTNATTRNAATDRTQWWTYSIKRNTSRSPPPRGRERKRRCRENECSTRQT